MTLHIVAEFDILSYSQVFCSCRYFLARTFQIIFICILFVRNVEKRDWRSTGMIARSCLRELEEEQVVDGPGGWC